MERRRMEPVPMDADVRCQFHLVVSEPSCGDHAKAM